MIANPSNDPGKRRAASVPGGSDRYEALLEVLEHQAGQAEESRTAPPGYREADGARTKYVVLAGLALVSAWLWLAPPSWIGVAQPEPRPIVEEEAALRFAMYVQAQRIKAFRLGTGRLPREIEEAGPPLPGMSYRLIDAETYELHGATDRFALTYRSDHSLQEFVGPGADAIDETAIP